MIGYNLSKMKANGKMIIELEHGNHPHNWTGYSAIFGSNTLAKCRKSNTDKDEQNTEVISGKLTFTIA